MITKERIRQILADLDIELNEKHINFIFRLSLNHENLAPLGKSRKQSLKELHDLIKQATALSDTLKNYAPWLEGHPEDIFLPVLSDWIARWEKSINYLKSKKDPAGAPRKYNSEIFFALCLINIYEMATGQSYLAGKTTNWGRERNAYNLRCYTFVTEFINEVFPSVDPIEILKLARKDKLLNPIFSAKNFQTLFSE